jgi:hypothetical protein
MALPDLPELTVDPVFPGPTVIRVLRALMASQARMELLVETVLTERPAPKVRPALKGPKAIRVEPETAKDLAPPQGRRFYAESSLSTYSEGTSSSGTCFV